MKIDIPVCTRGTLKEFKESYRLDFLEKYGYKRYTKAAPFSVITVCEAVNVKYNSIQGELIVHDNDVLTYLGHRLWAVTKAKEFKDGTTQG